MKKRAARSDIARAKPPFKVNVWAETGRSYASYISRHLKSAHKLISPALGELSIALAGEDRMRQLHKRFMNRPTATDVLTFELEHDKNGRVTAGEVVICVPVAKREAIRHLSPSPGTPGEGWGEGDVSNLTKRPSPRPLPAYQERGKQTDPVARELLLYALHGMLHLCGFDDKTVSGFQAMHRKEDEILLRLGVGPVFRPMRKSVKRKISGAG